MSGIILVLVLYVKYRPNRQELIVEGKMEGVSPGQEPGRKKTDLRFS